mgnify:CR=1 FL=1
MTIHLSNATKFLFCCVRYFRPSRLSAAVFLMPPFLLVFGSPCGIPCSFAPRITLFSRFVNLAFFCGIFLKSYRYKVAQILPFVAFAFSAAWNAPLFACLLSFLNYFSRVDCAILFKYMFCTISISLSFILG